MGKRIGTDHTTHDNIYWSGINFVLINKIFKHKGILIASDV